MKTKLLALSFLLASLAFTGCGHSADNNDDTVHSDGNNNKTDENSGNHANTPNSEPGTEYPGSAGDSTGHMRDTTYQHR